MKGQTDSMVAQNLTTLGSMTLMNASWELDCPKEGIRFPAAVCARPVLRRNMLQDWIDGILGVARGHADSLEALGIRALLTGVGWRVLRSAFFPFRMISQFCDNPLIQLVLS